jgi:hypothetical protein
MRHRRTSKWRKKCTRISSSKIGVSACSNWFENMMKNCTLPMEHVVIAKFVPLLRIV